MQQQVRVVLQMLSANHYQSLLTEIFFVSPCHYDSFMEVSASLDISQLRLAVDLESLFALRR